MKRILIWDISFPNTNSGGPAGYLYNIRKHLSNNPEDNIVFLSELLELDLSRKSKSNDDSNNNVIWKFLYDIKKLYNLYFRKYLLPKEIELNQYDIIHFHVIYDVFRYSKYLDNYKGKVLLTSHMPEPPIVELSYSFFYIGRFIRRMKNLFIAYELHFVKSIKIQWMFPAPSAVEPYINSSIKYKKYFGTFRNNIHYVPTCTLDYKVTVQNEFFKQYGIPQNAYVFTYIGRHNSIKGYDVLLEIGKHVLSKYDNVYFVIAGKEEPLSGMKNERWIELGWVNNSAEIIANSDLFILPNKQTYFDLIVLEVLRSGTPLLTTLTGGNKYFHDNFSRDENEGIMFFNSLDYKSAIKEIDVFINNPRKKELGIKNRQLWEKNFRLSNYINNYIQLINSL